jgi:hypothetical protein
VADLELSSQLAEIGVMLLMFGVGLHFSLDDLLAVRRIALPGAIVQIVVATLLGIGVSTLWGWNLAAGVVFGLALSVASTVVLLRALESRGMLETVNGRIAVGWLVVEDLVMVLVLVLLPPLSITLGGNPESHGVKAGDRAFLTTLALTLGQVAVFIALMLVVGRRLFPKLLWQVARTGSRELFTLCVIATAVGIAYGSAALFGVSFALLPRGRRVAAVQGRFLGAVFRFGWHAIRTASIGPRAGPRHRGRGNYNLWQILGRFHTRPAFPLSIEYRAHRLCKPGADRRIFFHLGWTGTCSGSIAGRRPELDSRRRDYFDRA